MSCDTVRFVLKLGCLFGAPTLSVATAQGTQLASAHFQHLASGASAAPAGSAQGVITKTPRTTCMRLLRFCSNQLRADRMVY